MLIATMQGHNFGRFKMYLWDCNVSTFIPSNSTPTSSSFRGSDCAQFTGSIVASESLSYQPSSDQDFSLGGWEDAG